MRNKLADLKIEFEVGRLLSYRVAWMQSQSIIPNYEASVSKMFGSELAQRLANAGVQVLGLGGQLAPDSPYAPLAGRFESLYLGAAALTVAAGTSEVMRNIIAGRGLGMPQRVNTEVRRCRSCCDVHYRHCATTACDVRDPANSGTVRLHAVRAGATALRCVGASSPARRSCRLYLSDAYLDNEVLPTAPPSGMSASANQVIRSPAKLTIVAEENGEIIGFAHSLVDEDAEWGTLLDNLHVHPERKRSGIGRRLMVESAATTLKRTALRSASISGCSKATPTRATSTMPSRAASPAMAKSHEGGSSVPSLRYWWPDLDQLSQLQRS